MENFDLKSDFFIHFTDINIITTNKYFLYK